MCILALGRGAGVSYTTARNWLGALECYLHGSVDFSLAVSCAWAFDADNPSRTVCLDGEPPDGLERQRVGYTELGVRSARVDRTCAAVLRQVANEVERRTDGRG